MLIATQETINKSITRTLTYRRFLQHKLKTQKVAYMTKTTPRKIDLEREKEILVLLRSLKK